MADLEAVLADVSYLMAMEMSKQTPESSKKIILPDPRWDWAKKKEKRWNLRFFGVALKIPVIDAFGGGSQIFIANAFYGLVPTDKK